MPLSNGVYIAPSPLAYRKLLPTKLISKVLQFTLLPFPQTALTYSQRRVVGNLLKQQVNYSGFLHTTAGLFQISSPSCINYKFQRTYPLIITAKASYIFAPNLSMCLGTPGLSSCSLMPKQSSELKCVHRWSNILSLTTSVTDQYKGESRLRLVP